MATVTGDPFLLTGGEIFQVNGAPLGRTIRTVFDTFGGAGRRDRIRYDTPKFAGLTVSVSHHNGDSWDAGLHCGATIGGRRSPQAWVMPMTRAVTTRRLLSGRWPFCYRWD